MAAIRKMEPLEREPAWEKMLDRARTNLDQFGNPPVQEWLQEALLHIDQDGPPPKYWPDDIPRKGMEVQRVSSLRDAVRAMEELGVSPILTPALELGIDLPDLNCDLPLEMYRQRLSNNRNQDAGGNDAEGAPDP